MPVYLDDNGCLHIKDDKLIADIKTWWGDNPNSICIVLEGKKGGGGGGAPANSMCACSTTVQTQSKNNTEYPEP